LAARARRTVATAATALTVFALAAFAGQTEHFVRIAGCAFERLIGCGASTGPSDRLLLFAEDSIELLERALEFIGALTTATGLRSGSFAACTVAEGVAATLALTGSLRTRTAPCAARSRALGTAGALRARVRLPITACALLTREAVSLLTGAIALLTRGLRASARSALSTRRSTRHSARRGLR
jgi:hypothetical protein